MFFDYHVHSSFSNDCGYPMEDIILDAIDQGIEELAFADHVDYGLYDDWNCLNPHLNYDGDPALNVDYPAYFMELERMRAAYGSRIRIAAGLEFGIQTHTIPRYEKLFSAWPLDFVLLSVHQVGDLEFWYPDNPFMAGRAQQEYNDEYYEELYRCVCGFKNYSVLAHMDLIRRYDPAGPFPTERNRDIIAAILEQVIADGKGIEANTSGYRYGMGDLSPATDIIQLYRDLGGTVITVGSDSHRPEHLGSRVRETYDLLRSIGFRSIATFERMEPAFHAL